MLALAGVCCGVHEGHRIRQPVSSSGRAGRLGNIRGLGDAHAAPEYSAYGSPALQEPDLKRQKRGELGGWPGENIQSGYSAQNTLLTSRYRYYE